MRIFCPAIVCSLSFRVLPLRASDARGASRSRGAWALHRLAPAMLHHCSAVKPDASASGSFLDRTRTHASAVVKVSDLLHFVSGFALAPCMFCCPRPRSCAFALPMHCPGSDPAHAKRGTGMWNLTSLRAARACRKPGRVARGYCRAGSQTRSSPGARSPVPGAFPTETGGCKSPLRWQNDVLTRRLLAGGEGSTRNARRPRQKGTRGIECCPRGEAAGGRTEEARAERVDSRATGCRSAARGRARLAPRVRAPPPGERPRRAQRRRLRHADRVVRLGRHLRLAARGLTAQRDPVLG